jgi:Uma2 family endonuclease
MSQRAHQLLTVEDFIKLPEYNERYELIDARLVEKPMPRFSNTRMQRRLLLAFSDFDREERLGAAATETSVFIRPHYSPAPDLSYWIASRVPPEDVDIAPRPDLAVEIQPEGQSLKSQTNKAKEYLDAGVQMVWILQPSKKTALVFHQGSAKPITVPPTGELDGGEVIPGFKIPLSELFR